MSLIAPICPVGLYTVPGTVLYLYIHGVHIAYWHIVCMISAAIYTNDDLHDCENNNRLHELPYDSCFTPKSLGSVSRLLLLSSKLETPIGEKT